MKHTVSRHMTDRRLVRKQKRITSRSVHYGCQFLKICCRLEGNIKLDLKEIRCQCAESLARSERRLWTRFYDKATVAPPVR